MKKYEKYINDILFDKKCSHEYSTFFYKSKIQVTPNKN